ncbi:hypothetical protein HDU92_009035 [Lobulomyces angularis]|nr:hypothetical protein HDU92_009035 [Lobulomyces angularis]
MQREIDWDNLDKTKFFLNGTGAFLGVRLLVYPSSLIKTRLQVSQLKERSGLIRTFFRIIRTEGPRALYQGFPTTAIGAVPAQIIYLSAYETTKLNVKKVLSLSKINENVYDPVANLLGGMMASLSSQSIVVPIDIVSQKLMIQQKNSIGQSTELYKNGFDVIKKTIRSEGIAGLYRGFFASMLTYAPSSGIWWLTHSQVKKLFMHFDEKFNKKDNNTFNSSDNELAFSAIAGVIAGSTSAFLTNPLDVIKTRMQTINKGESMKQVFYQIYNLDGAGGFYRGVSARMINVAPVSFLMILSYEIVKKMSLKTNHNINNINSSINNDFRT